MTHYQERQAADKTLRAVMSVAAAICVLGLASLVFIHAPDVAFATADTAANATDTTRTVDTPGVASTSNVPSADSIFHGKGYVPPEEPIAQF